MDRDVGHHPDGVLYFSLDTPHPAEMCCTVCVCRGECISCMQREDDICLCRKNSFLKVGYKAEVGGDRLKLHFHSALHAKPLEALKKVLEAVQHQIALAPQTRKTNLLPRFGN